MMWTVIRAMAHQVLMVQNAGWPDCGISARSMQILNNPESAYTKSFGGDAGLQKMTFYPLIIKHLGATIYASRPNGRVITGSFFLVDCFLIIEFGRLFFDVSLQQISRTNSDRLRLRPGGD
jgi:hypothetical protein